MRCVCHTMYGKIREQQADYKTFKLKHIRVNLSSDLIIDTLV